MITQYLGSCWYRRRDRVPTSDIHKAFEWKTSEPLCGNLIGFGQEQLGTNEPGTSSVVGIVEAVPDGTIILIPAEDICMTRGNEPVFRNPK